MNNDIGGPNCKYFCLELYLFPNLSGQFFYMKIIVEFSIIFVHIFTNTGIRYQAHAERGLLTN